MGGSTAPETNLPPNLLHLCAPHHIWVESNRAAATTKGLLLSAAADPAQVPVWTRHSDELVYLTGDGLWVPFEEACA